MFVADGFSWCPILSKHRWKRIDGLYGEAAMLKPICTVSICHRSKKSALPFHLIINGDTCAWLAHWLPYTRAQDNGRTAVHPSYAVQKPMRFSPGNRL